MTVYPMYRCKCCGVVFNGPASAGTGAGDALSNTIHEMNSGGRYPGRYDAEVTFSHYHVHQCHAGGQGIAELIGMAIPE